MIKNIAIRTVTTFSWRLSRPRLAKSMHRFSEVEADSAWQILQAIDDVDNSHYRAKLFHNALEEVAHAELFHRLARNYSDFPLPLATRRRQAVYKPGNSIADFEAYLFLAEAEVYGQFLSYAAAAPELELRETFLAIREDEEGHQNAALEKLQQLVQNRTATGHIIRRNRAKRMYQAWLRIGEALGDLTFWVLLNFIYLIASPTLGWLCKRRLNSISQVAPQL